MNTDSQPDDTQIKRKGLRSWLFYVDQILRGDATKPESLSQGGINVPILGVSVVVIFLGVIYGFCMGVFSLIYGAENNEYTRAFLQTFASMCKVPLLFVLTLLITFPSLYVFNALIGSRLKMLSVLKLLIASLAVNLAVLASMGPILAFFSASTPSYPFIVLLNVALFALAGALGLTFLLQTLNRLARFQLDEENAPIDSGEATLTKTSDSVSQVNQATPSQTVNTKQSLPNRAKETLAHPQQNLTPNFGESSSASEQPGPAKNVSFVSATIVKPTPQPSHHPMGQLRQTKISRHVKNVFGCWILVFGLVGAQLGWILRPFIGSPDKPFQWFRPRDSNFFEAVTNTFWNLF